jgi:predicted ribosomally synthesized peptide with nif11-like leader
MSEEQLKAFMEAVATDKALQKKFKAATDDVVVAIAKQAGFVFTAEVLTNRSLSDEELEALAGGRNDTGQNGSFGGMWGVFCGCLKNSHVAW